MAKVKVTVGKDFDFFIKLRKKNGDPESLTDWSVIKILFNSKTPGAPVELRAPVTPGIDEIQTLSFSAVPASGTFTLTHDGNQTTDLAFGASALDIQNALNALKSLSTVTVTGSFAADFVITFTNDDGNRDQLLLLATPTDLKDGANADITITPAVTTPGVPTKGIEVTDAACGILHVFGTEDESEQMAEGGDLPADLQIRIKDRDLNIKPLENFVDVLKSGVA